MIKSATALKANVKNIANNNSKMAQAYIRLFFMERFLERVSKSRYKEQFILKGGMLVSSMIGMSLRTTMDIDTSIEEAMRIMKEVASDSDMENRWGQFRKKNDFVGDIMYKQLMDALMETTNKLFHTSIDRSSYEN